jgi:hypothetical protein
MTDEPHNSDFVTPAHIDSLITCMENIHKSFDSFFEIDVDTIRNLPNLFFVRNAYAAVALIKMDGVLHTKGSKFGPIFAPNLKVESYLDTMIEVQERAAEGGTCNVSTAFGFVFRKLKGWYQKKRDGQAGSAMATATSSQQLPSCSNLMEVDDEDPGLPSVAAISREVFKVPVQVADTDPTTTFDDQDQAWAAEHLGLPYEQGGYAPGINDTTMFSLGLPQLYDFGFTFDDRGFSNNAGEDTSWMGFSI